MRTIKSFIFWSYERGSIQYDVMVTLILLFLFVGPRFIDFKDEPAPPVPIRSSEVLIKNADATRLTYEVRTEGLADTSSDDAIRASLTSAIRPVAGEVTLESYKPVFDTHDKLIAYTAQAHR